MREFSGPAAPRSIARHALVVWLLCGVVMSMAVACSGEGGQGVARPSPSPSPERPTPVPTVVQRPLTTPTRPPEPGPPSAPTAAPQAETVTFYWAPEIIINDADDILHILLTIKHPGILDGYGDEQSITIRYDPSLITPAEIRARLNSSGHPVE